MNARFSEPSADRLVDHALKSSAMDRELRDIVASVEPARLAPDLLPKAVGVEQLVSADRNRIKAFEQAEFGQFLDGMRQCIDTDTKFPDGICLLKDFAVDPARVQHKGRHKSADAGPNNNDLHGQTLLATTRVDRKVSVPCAAENATTSPWDGYGRACGHKDRVLVVGRGAAFTRVAKAGLRLRYFRL